MRKFSSLIAATAICFAACQSTEKKEGNTADKNNGQETSTVTVPVFQSDSAYAYTQKQVSFGPRIPGTPAQQQCATWLLSKLRPLADTVYEVEGDVWSGVAQV